MRLLPSFPHEMDHSLGFAHAVGDTWSGDPPGTERGSGRYYYSHGWHPFVSDKRYATVMAYSNIDYRYSTTATKIPFFSNPDVLYLGNPTGVSLDSGNAASNADSINKDALEISNWKPTALSPEPPKNVSATKGTSGAVVITWNKVFNGTHYRIYRSEQETNFPEAITDWLTFPQAVYEDTACEPFKAYVYYMKAARSGKGSLPSAFSTPTAGYRKFLPPNSLQASPGKKNGIECSWCTVDYAVYYKFGGRI